MAECLDSVINQTYPNIEIICINDGSTDGSLRILNQYATKDERIKIISQKNTGVSGARNEGLKIASGEWVLFVDPDDWIAPEMVETCINEAVENNCDIVAMDYVGEYNSRAERYQYMPQPYTFSGKEYFVRLLGPLGKQLSSPEKLDALSMVCNKLYRASLFTGKSFTSLQLIGTSEDLLLNLQIAKQCQSVKYIPFAPYHYRRTVSSSTTQRYKAGLIDKWDILYDMIYDLVDHNNPNEETAFFNRVACSLIGSGLNEVKNSVSFWKKCDWTRATFSKPRYKASLKKLSLSHITSYRWKMFFFFAKNRMTVSFTFTLCAINEILKHRKYV